MKKLIFFFFLLFLSFLNYAQIKPVRSDTVKLKNAGLGVNQLAFVNVNFVNPGFEDGLLGWTVNGNAFTQIVGGNMISSERVRTEMLYENGGIGGDYWKSMSYPIGAKGNRWIGSFERGNGDAAIGSLVSAPFKMDKQYLNFLLGGGQDINKLYVELQIKGTSVPGYGTTADGYTRVKKITPEINSEEFFRYQFNVAEITGKNADSLRKNPLIVRIIIVDSASSGPWGHINVDDFITTDCGNNFLTISRDGKILYADKDKPVWGFADTHTHPMGHLAFGGMTLTGLPDGPMEIALATIQCEGNNHDAMGIQQFDPHLPYGYPTFSGWPKFNVQVHQPMYIDWIKRSFEGGLKLISVLGVTNMFWATRALGVGANPDLPVDDESVVLLGITKFKEIAERNKDWMEIALSPQDARRIILSNKMAVVLGVEMDNFGDFKDESYVYKEPYSMDHSKPLTALPSNNDEARVKIQEKINQYYDLGIRQVTPLHYISGVFGGTAVFRYQFGMIQSAFTGKPYWLQEGSQYGVNYNLNQDVQALQAIFGAASEVISGAAKSFYSCTYDGWKNPSFDSHCENFHSMVNAQGLTPKGYILMEEFMKKGMIVDMAHTSLMSAANIFGIAERFKYPVLFSHSDPLETCMGAGVNPVTANWIQDNHEANYRNFGTTAVGNLSTEINPTKSAYQKIAGTGGMTGLFTFPYRKVTDAIVEKNVANDCDGSSKSWAQNYLYTTETMPGKGVGIATDKGFTQAVGPRFGPMASYKLIEEKTDYLSKVLRTQQRWSQDNAVKYDIPFYDWNPKRFAFGEIDEFETDMWKALAFWATHPDIRTANPKEQPDYANIPNSNYTIQTDRIKNLVIGLSITDVNNLLPTGIFSGTDQPWQQAIMYCYSHNTVPGNLPKSKYEGNYLNWVQEKYDLWKPVYNLWQRMVNGTNEPLRKLVNGNRDWDFNLDGMAHYGMIPDFIQDLKNVGIKADQMMPLFSSAEEYIRMWEKADSASGKNSVCTSTSSSISQTGCNSYTSPSGKYKWTTTGTYKDTIQNYFCCDSVITINLTIQNVDTAVAGTGPLLTAHAKGATYQWINCATNEPIPQATAATLSTANGNYAVSVTQNGCTAVSSCYPINMLVISPPVKSLSLPLQKFSGATKIVAGDRKNNSEFGRSVSISGNYAVVGVPYERADVNNQNEMNQSGAAYIFERNTDSTWKQVQKVAGADRAPGDHFGWSVGISGNNIVVGAIYDRKDAEGNDIGTSLGSAYIFERNADGNWTQVQKIGPTPLDGYSYFGGAVGIDGNTIVVGAVGHSKDTTNDPLNGYVGDGGALFVFEKSGSNWVYKQKLIAKDRTQSNHGENLGNSVSINGNYIIAGAIGSRFDENNDSLFESAGAAYIFERSGGNWKAVQKIVASDRSAYDEFGYAVSISGDNAIIGARGSTLTADENYDGYSGTAYIFSRSQTGKWNEALKIIPADRKSGDRIGTSVAINGDYALVGAPANQVINPGDGAIYVYWLSGDGKWAQVQKLSSSDHGTYAGMGCSVAIGENIVIAGAAIEHRDLTGKNELSGAGAAYIFERPSGLKNSSALPVKFKN